MANSEITSLLDLFSGVVALLISYYAYKNNKLVGSILLRYISAGFLLLGVSLFLQAGTDRLIGMTAVEAVNGRGVEIVLYLLYTALQLVAYGVFAWGYGLSVFARNRSAAQAPVPLAAAGLVTKGVAYAVLVLAVYIASQVGTIFLLFLIVVQGVRVFTHSKSNLALMVLFGFSLIFAGHLLMLGGVVSTSSQVFLVGNTIEFCGFLSLLFFLVWSGRVVK